LQDWRKRSAFLNAIVSEHAEELQELSGVSGKAFAQDILPSLDTMSKEIAGSR
jgi:hypothetical protein